ncbi:MULTISPECIES: hypothetical protein [Winkia]|uniref:Lipoprotein n=1 Tax=Winkia neuii subsp. anitrata TaxID=29318 RepID=A0AB38XNC5_9ACTO|nr:MULTISPECIES: hypothetical protein [Winkia]MDK7163858.1 hypothetical protein [Winkia sp. UMB3105]MDK8595838.1 hypothetical protein [Winkia sp. UMB1096A]MDU2269635.1 hypothetical protein [Winkia neuii]WCE45732.1 hypothetical protein PIG85_08785 [Winkia neuii subsp. anitrata]
MRKSSCLLAAALTLLLGASACASTPKSGPASAPTYTNNNKAVDDRAQYADAPEKSSAKVYSYNEGEHEVSGNLYFNGIAYFMCDEMVQGPPLTCSYPRVMVHGLENTHDSIIGFKQIPTGKLVRRSMKVRIDSVDRHNKISHTRFLQWTDK